MTQQILAGIAIGVFATIVIGAVWWAICEHLRDAQREMSDIHSKLFDLRCDVRQLQSWRGATEKKP